jgi:hypothetical protein
MRRYALTTIPETGALAVTAAGPEPAGRAKLRTRPAGC